MSVLEIAKATDDLIYSQARLRGLIARAEPAIRLKFLEGMRLLRNANTLDDLADLIARGRIDEALAGLDAAIDLFVQETGVQFVRAGQDGAAFLSRGLNIIVVFDQTNDRAVAIMQNNRLRLVQQMTAEQRDAIREALTDGVRRGINPRAQAREFRSSIGLTRHQVRAVNRYRELLEQGSTQALQRQLRDRRFDRTVRAASRDRVPLSSGQIDRMVERYRERFLAHRAQTIARTESLRSVHEGTEELFQQVFDSGHLTPDQVQREWHTARDDRVRDPAHTAMRGQTRPEGVPFTDGLGNSLRYPGDPAAPGSTTIMCRCSVSRRIKKV